ncbi:hypothetical protein F3Y22_tig00110198pilonHSYRG00342 [Hibiscus syriacus]|uniref:Uncharacterized protein n=1 Tax=Hibiscus syriacus TaxID=106335 RepID=A0A6A3BHD2_HIBSY|nr:hypothetical protein F3Y22_tig00110198pilonHSYRG00342 [Hibiscus syriacus]
METDDCLNSKAGEELQFGLGNDVELGLEKSTVGVDSDDDEPILSLLKLRKHKNPKKVKAGLEGSSGKCHKDEVKAVKTVDLGIGEDKSDAATDKGGKRKHTGKVRRSKIYSKAKSIEVDHESRAKFEEDHNEEGLWPGVGLIQHLDEKLKEQLAENSVDNSHSVSTSSFSHSSSKECSTAENKDLTMLCSTREHIGTRYLYSNIELRDNCPAVDQSKLEREEVQLWFASSSEDACHGANVDSPTSTPDESGSFHEDAVSLPSSDIKDSKSPVIQRGGRNIKSVDMEIWLMKKMLSGRIC